MGRAKKDAFGPFAKYYGRERGPFPAPGHAAGGGVASPGRDEAPLRVAGEDYRHRLARVLAGGNEEDKSRHRQLKYR